MTATAHALVGGAIASATTQNPSLGLSLAFISHPLLDLIPHWDFGIGWREKTKIRLFVECSLDCGVGISLAYFIFGQNINLWYFLAVLFVSESWDIAEAPYWFLNWKFSPFSTIYRIMSKLQNKMILPWGIVTQVVTVVIFILLFQYIGLSGYQL